MILSGNYSLWFGEWHWNNNQESCRVAQSLKMIQRWTKRKGESLEAQANNCRSRKGKHGRQLGLEAPWTPDCSLTCLTHHMLQQSDTTKVSQRWGLCCKLWCPQSTLGDDFGEHHPHRYMKMIVRSKGLQGPSNITGKSCQTREKPIKIM